MLDEIKHTETCRCFVRVILYEEIDGHMNHLEYHEENRFTQCFFDRVEHEPEIIRVGLMLKPN